MKQTDIFGLVENELQQMETELSATIASPIALVTEMGTHLLRAGGKRLRPGLYLLCAGANENLEEKMPVAVALELIHMATLVHDDVLDQADTRRGEATANAVWGNHAAVLAGDYLFTKACSLVATKSEKQVLQVITDIISTICEGEIFQIQDKFNYEQSEEGYLQKITQKTADFIGASCKLGGMIAGYDEESINKLYRYGWALGMAYQITDDLLDITATKTDLGKPVCSDLRQGILTLPALYALQHSPRKEELKALIATRDMSDATLAKCMKIIEETDAMKYSYHRLAQYLELAEESLPDLLPAEHKTALQQIVRYIGQRKY